MYILKDIDFDMYLLGHDMPSNKEKELGYLREYYFKVEGD